jgi:sortase A
MSTATHRGHPARGRSVVSGVIGVSGEILVTLGVLLALFLVWQLWWTDVIAGRDQDGLLAGFDDQYGAVGQQIAPRQEGPPPVPDQPTEGQVFGTLHIPAFSRDRMPLAEGVDLETVLNVKGVGHYPETALPGQEGNFSVAGHRNTYGRPFYEIAELREGDAIVVETGDAFYVYEMTEAEVVTPEQVEVIAPVPGEPGAEPTERMLTLTACHPLFSARERYVVHAEFVYWTDRADGIPEALAEN